MSKQSRCLSRSGEPKKTWATEKAARFVADWQTFRKNPTDWYHCTECQKWHVTTIKAKRRRQVN